MLTKKENLKDEVKSSKTAKTTSSSTTPVTSTKSSYPTPNAKTTSTLIKTATPQAFKSQQETQSDTKPSSKTRITIKYDAGYPNQLYIRGKGANLNWEKGQPLKNVKADEWIWETDIHFTHCEFKILINDRVYENGDNHHLNAGATLLYTPYFY